MRQDFSSGAERRGWSPVARTSNGGVADWVVTSGELRQTRNTGGSNFGTAGTDVTSICRSRAFSASATYEPWGREFWPDYDFEARIRNDDDDRIMLLFNFED